MVSSVLITDAQSRAGLSVIRSLGEKHIRIVAADRDRMALGFFSRYCSRRLIYPDPILTPEDYGDFILDELSREPYDLIIPLFDGSLLPLARRKTAVDRLTRFPFLDYCSLMMARDKARVIEIARRCGLRVPSTFTIHCPEDANHALSALSLPLIVRPREAEGSKGLCRVERAGNVWRTCEMVASKFGPVIIQEYIPWGGFTYDVDVLMNRHSDARAVVVCKRLRTYPTEAGPTSCGQAVVWPELADMAISLLKELSWFGPAEVEFRIDPRDGKPTLMEVNPRLWGSLYTGILAGVDFPYLLYRLAMDGDVPTVSFYHTDLKARYFFTLDLLCMLTHPKRRSIAREWIGGFFDHRTRIFIPSWRDPLPLLGKLVGTLVYGTRPSRLKQRLRRVKIN